MTGPAGGGRCGQEGATEVGEVEKEPNSDDTHVSKFHSETYYLIHKPKSEEF